MEGAAVKMNTKEKILMILPRKLFPLVSGYSLKNYYLIQILAREYEITLYLLSKEEIQEEEREFYTQYVQELHVCQLSSFERFTGLIYAGIKGLPLQSGLYFSSRIEKKLRENAKKNYKLVICELVRTMMYSEKMELPIVFDMVDSIGLNYQEAQKKTNSIFLKLYYKFETDRLLKYEKHSIQRANVTFLFNQGETEYWKHNGNVKLLPHGVREELLDYAEDEAAYEILKESLKLPEEFVSFIGKMNYQPNVDAVSWYVDQVHSKLENAPALVILGAYPTDHIKQLTKQYKNIIVTGYMDDPYLILKKAIAVIAPMQTGGGIQNKVLEAMALGKINLLSSKAAAPIGNAEEGKEYMICDTFQQYRAAYERIRRDPGFGKKIGENARKFVNDNFTWKRYGTLYLDEIRQIRKG